MIGNYIILALIFCIFLTGIVKKIDVFGAFSEGVREGFASVKGIFPPLLGLICGVSVLSASGFFDALSAFFAPILTPLGFPSELIPLGLVKPFSGSGSTALLKNIFSNYGADSFIGKAASIMCAATETTFYAVSVYFGSVGIKKSAHTIPCALIGDFVTIVLSVVFARIF